jgi:hypothetical protein
MARVRLLVVIVCLLAVGAAAPAGAVPVTYSGQITNGSGGGNAWSYGGQAGGPTIFALDPASAFSYTFDDVNGNGLDAGDVLGVNATIDIVDYAGDILGSHTLGGSLGTLTLTGSFTVGGATGGYYTSALDGALAYTVALTATPSHNATPALGPGDTLTGSLPVTGGIVGYGSGQPDLHFSFNGVGGASVLNGLPGGPALGFRAGVSGVPTDCSEVPPPPGCGPPPSSVAEAPSLALLGAGLLVLTVVSRRRLRA